MPSKGIKPIRLEDEYRKNTGITPEDIAKLRQWLKTQPHLPEEHITDLDLIFAYHCCNHSAELAKQVLDLNLTLRTLFATYFKDRKVDAEIEKVFSDILLTILPSRTSEGYAVLYSHLVNCDPKQFNLGLAIRAVLMLLDMHQLEDGTWPGFVIIMDFEGVTLGHLARIDLQNVQRFLYYVQEAILVKLKGMHFLNAPSFIDKLLLMMKPFLKKQLMDALYIHPAGSNTMEKLIPIEIFPKETGGKHKTFREIQVDKSMWYSACPSPTACEHPPPSNSHRHSTTPHKSSKSLSTYDLEDLCGVVLCRCELLGGGCSHAVGEGHALYHIDLSTVADYSELNFSFIHCHGLPQGDVLENIMEYKDFFENENKKRVIETLRPGKPKTISDIFGGVEGSFKKLEID